MKIIKNCPAYDAGKCLHSQSKLFCDCKDIIDCSIKKALWLLCDTVSGQIITCGCNSQFGGTSECNGICSECCELSKEHKLVPFEDLQEILGILDVVED